MTIKGADAAPAHGSAGMAGPSAQIGAVVTGASYRSLAVVRSLGRRGVPVRLARGGHAVADHSRYAGAALEWALGDDRRRVESLVALARRERLAGWVLIPTHDEEARLIARHHDELAQVYRLTTPPWETLRDAYDKRRTYALAARRGLDQPWTMFPACAADLAAAEGRFPVIVKPAYKATANRLTAEKAWRADDAGALRSRYEAACRLVDPAIVMVQELVPGDGAMQLSLAALCSGGEIAAGLTARRMRQYPIDFGRASSYVETVEDPAVERDARRLLEAMNWTGIIEVEFKRDPRTGANKLLDVNPRAWGWQSLGGRAGVDFPYLLWRLAQGQPVPRARPAAGVRWVRMATDPLAAAGEIRAGRLSLRSYLWSLRRPLEFAVFTLDDPLPALIGPLLTTRAAAGRRLAGRRGTEPVPAPLPVTADPPPYATLSAGSVTPSSMNR
jgi:D-aspartate ligase